MQSTRRMMIVALAVAAFALTVHTASAADATVGLDAVSGYIWRGLTLSDDAVLQPSVDVEHPSGLGINVWGNFNLGDYNETYKSGEFSELDLTLYYLIPVEQVDLSIGWISYIFPGEANRVDADSTREVYLSLDQDLSTLGDSPALDGLGWGLFAAYDLDEVDDYYANVSLTYGYAVNEQLDLELEGLVGYVGSDWSKIVNGGNGSGWNEWQAALTGTYSVTKTVELGGFVAYVDSLDKDVLPSQVADVYGGLTVYYSF